MHKLRSSLSRFDQFLYPDLFSQIGRATIYPCPKTPENIETMKKAIREKVIKYSPAVSLEDFLKLPETKPASEYIDDRIIQKTMPKARHSRLQAKLTSAINEVTESSRIAYAFPELRCTFGDRSTVPDLAVLLWGKIEFDVNGEPIDNVVVAPDWTIEVLSPEQSANRVTGNILHCLTYGCQLGWLIDPDDRSILVFRSQQQPELLTGENVLPVLAEIDLTLTVAQVFSWLQMGG